MRLHPTTLLSLAVFAATPAAFAQVSPSPREPAAPPAVVLSPFVVDTTADRGYQASSTLAGSRIKTDLKDVAASVTVLTREFMDDLAANDVNAAMAFVGGAENPATTHFEQVGTLGAVNGYVGTDFGDNNNNVASLRVRGLGGATNTLDFMPVLGSTDRYNVERVEFLRGANSVLFGLSSPAGLLNSSSKVAGLARRATTIETKFDQFGSHRALLDHNEVLLAGRLAVRAVGLYNDQRYRVETAFARDRRGFLTATYRPFRDTVLRASAERVENFGRRPNFRTPQDNVSEWLEAYNRYAPQLSPAQVAQAFYWDPTVTPGNAPASTFTLANGTTVNLGLIRRPLDSNALGTAFIYSGNGDWTNLLGNVVTIFGARTITGAAGSPASQFARTGAARENDARFAADPQVTSKGIFPYDTVELGALPGNWRREKVGRFNVTLEQRLAEGLHISAAVQREQQRRDQYFAIIAQTHQIQVDINQKLPDGRANPNFLRPFIYGRNIAERADTEVTNYLVQANYDFDFAKSTRALGWLGSHRLSGVYTRAESDSYGTRWHYQVESDLPGVLPAADAGANATGQSSRYAMQLWYVGDAVKVGDTALRFTGFPDDVARHVNRSYDYLYFNNLVSPGAWQRSPSQIRIGEGLIPNAAIRTWSQLKNSGTGYSMQSFFWRNRVVTLLGWRRDEVEPFLGTLKPASQFPFPALPGASRADFLPPTRTYRNERDTTTQSIVLKASAQLRVFANRSENFAATSPRQDNLFRPIAPASGKTEEYGVGAALFGGKLDLKLTRFQSSQLYSTNQTGVAQLSIPSFEANLYNALIAAGRGSEWSTIGLNGPTNAPYALPNGAAATRDGIAKGHSLEVYFQPGRNWNIYASIDELKQTASNLSREATDFLNARAAYYRKYFDEGLRLNGSTAATSTSELLRDNFANVVVSRYASEIATEGTSNRGVSPWSAKMVGRYAFTEGRLRGFVLGTNLRWESSKVVGYANTTKVLSVGGLQNYPVIVSDVAREYRTDPVFAGGAFASYSRRILGDKVRWKVQLNAQDVFSKVGLRVIAANGDGSPIWAMSPSRAYELTNRFEF